MVGAATVPETVYTGIELERRRLREAFETVYREDGSIDEAALARFARALGVAR